MHALASFPSVASSLTELAHAHFLPRRCPVSIWDLPLMIVSLRSIPPLSPDDSLHSFFQFHRKYHLLWAFNITSSGGAFHDPPGGLDASSECSQSPWLSPSLCSNHLSPHSTPVSFMRGKNHIYLFITEFLVPRTDGAHT